MGGAQAFATRSELRQHQHRSARPGRTSWPSGPTPAAARTSACSTSRPARQLFNFYAYAPNFTGGVRVAVGDVNGDGTPDIITAPGAGGGPHIKVFDGKTGALIRCVLGVQPDLHRRRLRGRRRRERRRHRRHHHRGRGRRRAERQRLRRQDRGDDRQLLRLRRGRSPAASAWRPATSTTTARPTSSPAAGPGGGPQVKIFNSASTATVANARVAHPVLRLQPGPTRAASTSRPNAFGQGDITGDGKTDLVVGTALAASARSRCIDGSIVRRRFRLHRLRRVP